MSENRNWTPQEQPGGIYCSPACGVRCTKSEHDEAHRLAAELCASLGDGWKPRVWENLGWHYSAEKGKMKIHPPYGLAKGLKNGANYSLFFNVSRQIVLSGPSPYQLVLDALTAAREHVNETQKEIDLHV
jgi:hypothetical protein